MSSHEAIVAFTVAAGILTITPGLDTALVLRTAALEGPRRGILAGLGICLGAFIWALGTAAGLGAIFLASHAIYDAIRLGGAAYLAYLGLVLLVSTLSRPDTSGAAQLHVSETGSPTTNWFLRGLMTNLLNPKVGIFYVTFLPQFIPSHVDVFLFSTLLASIHAGEGLVWFIMISLTTQQAGAVLTRPGFRKTIDRILGFVFLGFAYRLAFHGNRD